MPKTAIVVPCYNEAARLNAAAFEEELSKSAWLNLLFVDDGSTDGTLALLNEMKDGHPSRISVLALSKNRGKAEAVRRGVLAATESDAVFIGYWDADLATPLSEIEPMLQVIEERDALMVLGSRIRMLGRSVSRKPSRHYAGRLFATATSLILGLSVYDTQCGAKIFRNSDLIKAAFEKPFESRWIFDVEILARLIERDRDLSTDVIKTKIIEYPLRTWRHIDGSRVKASDFQKAMFDLARIAKRLHSKRG